MDDILTRWFAALDSADFAALKGLCRIDVKSELVGRGRLQRSDDGLIQELQALHKNYPDGFWHDWELVCHAGSYGVVTWTRTSRRRVADGGVEPPVEGVAFVRTRSGKMDLYRAYETAV